MIREIYYTWKLRKQLRLERSSLEKSRLYKLKRILKHCQKQSPYYQKLFQEYNFNPDNLKSVQDLTKLPILTKLDLQQNTKDILAKHYHLKKLIKHTTSGSTGIPLIKYNDKKSEAYNIALRYRSYFENGMKFWDKVVEFTSPLSISKNNNFLKNMILRKKRISIFEDPEKMIKILNSVKPTIIQSYPSVLVNLVDNAKDRLNFAPRIIFTTSEILHDKDRKKISDFFNCKVIDTYGCEECNRVAWECEAGNGYHLDEDCYIIEIVDHAGRPSKTGKGRIIITSLIDFAFPLIRYDLGDIIELKNEKCTCGRNLSMVKTIYGREDDFIKLSNGTRVSPRNINLLEEVSGIKAYKITQESVNKITVNVVPLNRLTKKSIKQIEHIIKRGCNSKDMIVNVKQVSKISRDKSGKIRTVVSKVK